MSKKIPPKSPILMKAITNHFNAKFTLTDDEKELWKQFSQEEIDNGAQIVFDKIFNLYFVGLFEWILSLVKSKEIAAHVMKDSFVILWRKRRKLTATITQSRNFFRSVVITMVMIETKKMADEWSAKDDKNEIDFWKWAEERKFTKKAGGERMLHKKS